MRSASRRLLCIIDHQRPGMRVFSPTCVAIVASLCVRRCGGESSLLSPLWQAASPFLPAWSLPVFVFDPFPFLSDRLLMHYKLLRLQKLWKNMKRGGAIVGEGEEGVGGGIITNSSCVSVPPYFSRLLLHPLISL